MRVFNSTVQKFTVTFWSPHCVKIEIRLLIVTVLVMCLFFCYYAQNKQTKKPGQTASGHRAREITYICQ